MLLLTRHRISLSLRALRRRALLPAQPPFAARRTLPVSLLRIRLAIHIYWWLLHIHRHHLLLILRLMLLVLAMLHHRWMWCVTPWSIRLLHSLLSLNSLHRLHGPRRLRIALWSIRLLHSLLSLNSLHSLHGPRRLRIALILPCPRVIYLRLICGVLRSIAGATSRAGLREAGGCGGR
jgi:hypothetical protein